MSKHFTAINRKTGKQWKSKDGSFLVMYDSGYLAEATRTDPMTFPRIVPLDIKEWKTVLRKPMQTKIEKFGIYEGEQS